MAGRVYKDISGAHSAVAIDLSSTDQSLTAGVRGIHVGGAGDVKVDFVGGGTGIVMSGCLAGIDYAWQVSKVYKTGTTATLLVALY